MWDSHGYLPMRADDERFLSQLVRYRRSGVDVVGLNVGFDAQPWEHTLRMLAHFRRWIRQRPRDFALVETPADFSRLRSRLGVFFDIEGGVALDGQLSLVELYRDLGVRWMLIAYNRNNALGGGCQDDDHGLTRFGRAVVREMERVGVTVCCSHTGARTTFDVLHAATKPVILSHSNASAVWPHPRNVSDAVLAACAATGGVIGVNGVGPFLGANDGTPAAMARHIDYIVQRVGIGHVGLGLDYMFDAEEIAALVRERPDLYPPEQGYSDGMRLVPPERIIDVAAELLARGYRRADVAQVLGGNFRRVAHATWPHARPLGTFSEN